MLFIFLISGDIRMNKKIKVTSAAAAALASLVLVNANVNNEVKADTKAVNDTKTTQKAQTPEEAARANVASAKKKVETEQGNVDKAQGNLDQAKKDAEKPDADYKAQSDKVDGLKKTVDQKNEALTDAKSKEKDAQALADEANDPAKVKDAITKQEGVVKNANDAKTNAEKAVTDKQNEIDKLGKDVKTDTQDVNDKTAAKKQADQAVKTAEDDLKGTGITEAKKKLDNANEAVEKTQKALKEANKAIEQANGDKTRAQTALATAQSAHATAVTNQKIAQKTYDDAKAASDAADKNLVGKKAEIKNINENISRLNVLTQNNINVGDADKYKKAYADYISSNPNPSERVLPEEDANYLTVIRHNNHFIGSKEDKDTVVDVNNLSDDQIKELSLFTADLLNKVRSQLGENSTDEVTPGAIDFTKQIIKKGKEDYKNGNWDGNWHDATGINELSKENGLDYNSQSDSNVWQYYEDKAPFYSDAITNMNNLKRNIYNSLNSMILGNKGYNNKSQADAETDGVHEMAHAAGLLNLRAYTEDKINSIKQFTEFLENNIKSDREILAHNPDATVMESVNGGPFHEVPLKQVVEENEKDLSETKDKIAQLEKGTSCTTINNKKYTVTLDKAQYVAVIPAVSERKSNLIDAHFINIAPSQIHSGAKFDKTIIPSYASQIKEVNSKLNQANNELPSLKSEAKRLDGITSGKSTDLNNKNTAVKGAQDSIDKANKDIKKANDALDTAQRKKIAQEAQLKKDKNAQKDAQKHYDDLTADNNLEAAKKAQEKAKNALSTANNTLTKAKNALDQAQNVDLPKLQKVADQKAKDATQAQTKLDQLKQHVEDLKNAATILANAKKALTDAQTAYDTAKKNYDDANEVLNGDLKTNKDKADAKVVAAQKAYDEAVAKLQAAKDALAKAQQKLQDILDAEYAQSIITSGPTETKKTDKQEPVKTPEATPETKTDDISTTPKKIRLTHNAFVYNKHGKLIRKGLHIKWIKRDKLVKVLKNAKIVKINGKRYYQIGRNKFVKVANFEITTHAVHFKARLKGNKKVRAYNRSGKFNKHYARPNHTYTFNEKAKINGKTYYKIAGTNNWISAKKLALKK